MTFGEDFRLASEQSFQPPPARKKSKDPEKDANERAAERRRDAAFARADAMDKTRARCGNIRQADRMVGFDPGENEVVTGIVWDNDL
mmetsp:Transcript_907/g.2694  ORF Transcript_907/g.2694 Transcript_907/m.2694 type:complete len:87 (-) Transcript_907:919-1179(-)